MYFAKFILTCAVLVLATCGFAHAGPITITSQLAETYAGSYVTGFDSDFFVGTALDGVDHTITATHAAGSNALTLNFSELSASATLSYEFDGGVSGFSTGVESYSITKFVAAGTSLAYSFSGNYDYSYPGPYGGLNGNMMARYYISLVDLTDNVMVFGNDQFEFNTTGPISYVLGGTAGLLPTLIGSPSGALLSGHLYELTYGTDSRTGTVAAASASGYVQFDVTSDVAEVPEPASLTLFGLGTFGLAVSRRRRVNSH